MPDASGRYRGITVPAEAWERVFRWCPCGHGESDHVDGICAAKLTTFPEGGWYGVCPCTPDWLAAQGA